MNTRFKKEAGYVGLGTIAFTLVLSLAFTLKTELCFAQESGGLDPASQEALVKTQTLLKTSEQRQTAIAGDANALSAHQQAESVAGSAENTQAMYELAADIFGDLAKSAAGDPIKLQELLLQAQKDPTSLASKLSPAQMAKLKEISKRAPAASAENPVTSQPKASP